MTTNAWIPFPSPAKQARCRLYCFPYAGRGASLFVPWTWELLPHVEVLPVQLPGRESRLAEPPTAHVSEIVEALIEALFRNASDMPFAFYGHSMGGLIAFELTRALHARGHRLPRHLIVAACPSPTVVDDRPSLRKASDEELVECLRELNGTPEEVLREPELLALILPIFRGDAVLIENYEYSSRPPIPVPIHIFAGERDGEVGEDDLAGWHTETCAGSSIRKFPGDHYFIHSCASSVQEAIREILGFSNAGGSVARRPDGYQGAAWQVTNLRQETTDERARQRRG